LWMENDRFSSVIEIMIAFVLWLKDWLFFICG
jgi:hypothetical protein